MFLRFGGALEETESLTFDIKSCSTLQISSRSGHIEQVVSCVSLGIDIQNSQSEYAIISA